MCSTKKGFLKNFAKITGKHLCQSLFFNKIAGLSPATLLKNRLWHRCFPVIFAKFLRTSFYRTPLMTASDLMIFCRIRIVSSKLAVKHHKSMLNVISHYYLTIIMMHCVKIFTVNLRIQSGYRKKRTRKSSVFGHFSHSDGTKPLDQ